MLGVEIDMVVSDSIKALETYERVFEARRVEATAFEKGLNEVVFTIFGTRFHLLDENAEYEMFAPKDAAKTSMWLNVVVSDVKATFDLAKANGFIEVTALTEMLEMGITNAMLSDPFGYVWMLHQIHREVSFEERTEYWNNKIKNDA